MSTSGGVLSVSQGQGECGGWGAGRICVTSKVDCCLVRPAVACKKKMTVKFPKSWLPNLPDKGSAIDYTRGGTDEEGDKSEEADKLEGTLV